MSTATVPQTLALFAALSLVEKRDVINALFNGAPTFPLAATDEPTLSLYVSSWINAGAIPADVLALACARAVAQRAPAVPTPPAPPVAPVATVAPAPAPVVVAPQATSAEPTPAPAESFNEALQRGMASASKAPSAAKAQPATLAAIAATYPTTPALVNARSLFADQPDAVLSRIPVDRMVMHYASAEAPAIDADYAFDPVNLAATLDAMSCTPHKNIWTYGPRGTGKTEFCRQIAARLGREFHQVNFHRAIDAEDLLGSLGIRNGETYFSPGPVTLAARIPGAVILFDEFTYCPAAHAASLNPVLARNGVRLSRTGERLNIAADVMFFAADNTGGHGSTSNEYTGRAPMGSDTLDRFAEFIPFDFLPAETERRVLRAMVKRACGVKPPSDMARSVIKLVGVARAKADIGELEGAPSLRRAVAFCTALVQGAVASEAYMRCVVNAAPEDSQETLKQIFAATWDHGTTPPVADPNANPFVTPSES